MKKALYTLCLLATAATASAAISGTWKIYPTFDNSVTYMADTPDCVYFTGLAQSVNDKITFKSTPENFLFKYDKEGDEIIGLSKNTGLSGTAINRIEYNGAKGYLVVVYNDYQIDFLLDNGEIHTLAALKTAQIPASKEINTITFYPKQNEIVFATGFGYMVVDDQKFEVKESRNYNRKLDSAARFGDRMLIAYDGFAYSAPYSDRRMSISDYVKENNIPAATEFIDMGAEDKRMVAIGSVGGYKNAYIFSNSADGIKLDSTLGLETKISHSRSKDGGISLVTLYGAVRHIAPDGKTSVFYRPNTDYGLPIASWNNSDFYCVNPRKGLRSMKANYGTTGYTITKDFSLPNAPNAYYSRGMVYHPDYGMLVNNYGYDTCFGSTLLDETMLLSAYRNGLWTPMSNAYRNPEQAAVGGNPTGLTVDIDDNKYIYTGSIFSGITRTNLDDPTDILHMSHPSDPTSKLPGYVKMHDNFSWSRISCYTGLSFDANGVLWTAFLNWDGPMQFWYWMPEDRRASKNPATFRPWKKITVPGTVSTANDVALALKSPVNRGVIVSSNRASGSPFIVYDHKNTLDTSADDEKVIMTGIYDQDGGVVSAYNVHCMYEDQDSGAVWVGCDAGLFFFQPRSVLGGQHIWNRVKIARNDGTSLADYLLNGITVTHIAADASNRKWISTNGAGIVVTTSDCRTVLEEFTDANSGLPSDVVFFSQYNPDNNSMMISTDKGIVEFALAGGVSADGSESTVRAYPNPVAPDYYGWVTIDGLPDNAHVKIADSEGNIVRELGRAETGTVQWDVLNLYGKRVRTGVYYILSSTNEGEANVAKILVMN